MHCGATIQFVLWQSINLAMNPEMAGRVISGDLFEVRCHVCEKINPVDYPLHYHDMANRRYCVYLSDEAGTKEMHSALNMAADLFGKTGSYQLWTVDTINGLREIARIWRDDLDDLAMLLAKTNFFMLNFVDGQHPDFVGYSGQEGDNLLFDVLFGEQCRQRELDRESYDSYREYVEPKRSAILPPNRWVDWSIDTGKKIVSESGER